MPCNGTLWPVGHLWHFVCGQLSCSVTPLRLVIGSHHLKCFSFALFRNFIINLFSERLRSILLIIKFIFKSSCYETFLGRSSIATAKLIPPFPDIFSFMSPMQEFRKRRRFLKLSFCLEPFLHSGNLHFLNLMSQDLQNSQ